MCRQRNLLNAKSTHLAVLFLIPWVTWSDSMSVIPIDRSRRAPSIVADEGPELSYEECLERLARVVAEPDSRHLDEVARLIGKLTVTIE
jgi:hypothetical protein